MAARILMLDASGLAAFRRRRGSVCSDGEFAADAAGLSAFRSYVERHRKSLYYLLADVAEEGFQCEDIPHVGGRDRAALVARKLQQHYPGIALAAALPLGRARTGRRDQRMLFAALMRPQQFEPWLEVLRQAQVALAGLYSLPQVVAPLAAGAPGAGRSLLLLTIGRGGLRQTYFEAGRLRFSRLTALAEDSPAQVAATCAAEAEKLRHYLAGQRLLAHEAALPVLVLADAALAGDFRAHCRDSATLHFELVDAAVAAARYGLKGCPGVPYGAALPVHLLLRHTPRQQFAGAGVRRPFRLRRYRIGLGAVGAAICAVCLALAAWQVFDRQRLDESTQRIRSATDADRHRLQAALGTLPQLPFAADELGALVGRYERLLRTAPSPELIYGQLSAALGDYPHVEIERVDWSAAEDKAATAGAANEPHVVVEVHGRVPASVGRRGQATLVDGFCGRLQTDGNAVQVLRRPFDAASDKAFSSDASVPPQFMLRVAQHF